VFGLCYSEELACVKANFDFEDKRIKRTEVAA